ncbi:MAG TPA: single-stranded-DNA-specific exonuclease RecJ [bacterium]|nr:single-stranded-DNA-specific exonuclease RecJ [bacterium]
MNKYKWNVRNQADGLDLLERIVFGRFGESADIDAFLRPDFKLGDPFLLPDMEKAVQRIIKAIEDKEKIVVFGDYDVDGVSATALLWEFFRYLGIDINVHIPDRFSEGYGLRESVLNNIFVSGTTLLITVDCGIRDVDLIKKMTLKGYDIIVTDHHSVGDVIPDCVAVVNPKRANNLYPEANLAGVGVAYALARAVLQKLGVAVDKRELFEKWHLDIVAIGTVADLMPLTGENRVIVRYGLKTLQRTKKIGLKKMMDLTGMEPAKIDSRSIGFVLGPRLNAAGRIDKAMAAFDVLTEREEMEVNILVKNLDDYNRERRNMTDQIINDIVENMEDHVPLAIVEADESWSRGVVGLVASRIVDKYYRPAFIAQIEDDKIVGSVRGIEGINVVKILDRLSDLLDHYGGHSMAGGFSLEKNKWGQFKERLASIVEELIDPDNLEREIMIDAVTEIRELNLNLWQKWLMMEPYGLGNEEPVLLSNNIKLVNKRIIGKTGEHLKLSFEGGGKYIDALWWKSANWDNELEIGGRYDVVYKIGLNEYRDRKKIEMTLLDIKKNNLL